MKRFILGTLVFALLLIFFHSCKKESSEQLQIQAPVEFTFSGSLLKSGSEQGLTNVIVTIEDLNGNVIKSDEKIPIRSMKDKYVSEPILLVTGEYKLTHFLVLNAANQVVYASPKEGSLKSISVEEPLPLTFSTQKDSVTKLTPGVLNVAGYSDLDFGYNTFNFDVADAFDFLIGAFVYDSIIKNFEATNAVISIYNNSVLVFSGQLYKDTISNNSKYDSLGVNNEITLPEKYNYFKIKISKDGYHDYSKTFSKEELRLHFRNEDKGPLVVILNKSSGCDFRVDFTANPQKQTWPNNIVYIDDFSIRDADSYVFDYGDGTGSSRTSFVSNFVHSYDSPGFYVIKLTITKNGCSSSYEKEISILPFAGDNIVTDIDGNIYHTVTIGAQVWMVENLKTTRYNDGTEIPLINEDSSWVGLDSSYYCWYENNFENKYRYGALYNWPAVNSGKLCPTRWHVPTDAEWTTLTNFLGGEYVAGGSLKAIGSNWDSPNLGATNSSGFFALPGGGSGATAGSFIGKGNLGIWWSSTIDNSDATTKWNIYRKMFNNSTEVNRNIFVSKAGAVNFLSVRCIKD